MDGYSPYEKKLFLGYGFNIIHIRSKPDIQCVFITGLAYQESDDSIFFFFCRFPHGALLKIHFDKIGNCVKNNKFASMNLTTWRNSRHRFNISLFCGAFSFNSVALPAGVSRKLWKSKKALDQMIDDKRKICIFTQLKE